MSFRPSMWPLTPVSNRSSLYPADPVSVNVDSDSCHTDAGTPVSSLFKTGVLSAGVTLLSVPVSIAARTSAAVMSLRLVLADRVLVAFAQTDGGTPVSSLFNTSVLSVVALAAIEPVSMRFRVLPAEPVSVYTLRLDFQTVSETPVSNAKDVSVRPASAQTSAALMSLRFVPAVRVRVALAQTLGGTPVSIF